MKPSVLITGSSGFVGSFLSKRLKQKGYFVRAVVRNRSVQESSGEHVIVCDIAQNSNWDEMLAGIDYVIHLAALAHQINKPVAAADFDRVNHQATAELARAVANSTTVRRLVFISSIGAVCSSSEKVITPRTEPNPDSDYGRSKRNAELAVQQILSGTPQDWCVLRPTLIYGPGNPGNMLRLMRLTRSPVPLPFGSIRNRRSFLYVENLVDLIEKVLANPGASRQVFNVADAEVLSTGELVRQLAGVTGREIRLLPMPVSALRALGKCGDVVSRITGRAIGLDTYSVERLTSSLEVDISPLRTQLQWEPPFTTEEGLRRTLSANAPA